jgi:hypothetical protein
VTEAAKKILAEAIYGAGAQRPNDTVEELAGALVAIASVRRAGQVDEQALISSAQSYADEVDQFEKWGALVDAFIAGADWAGESDPLAQELEDQVLIATKALQRAESAEEGMVELFGALEHVLNNLSMVPETSMDPVLGPTYYCYGIHTNKARDTFRKFKSLQRAERAASPTEGPES